MKPIALPLLAALALAACAKSDKASDAASADNVEMPAEEAMSGISATPVADPSALATEAAEDAAGAAVDKAGSAANQAASAAGDAASTAGEAAKAAAKSAAAAAGTVDKKQP